MTPFSTPMGCPRRDPVYLFLYHVVDKQVKPCLRKPFSSRGCFEHENAQIIGNLIEENVTFKLNRFQNCLLLSNIPFYTSKVSTMFFLPSSPPAFVAANRSRIETQTEKLNVPPFQVDQCLLHVLLLNHSFGADEAVLCFQFLPLILSFC